MSSATPYLTSSTSGPSSNSTSTLCDILQPCLNHGTCFNSNTTRQGYNCSCSTNFTGTDCQLDLRLCRLGTCRNDGDCVVLTNGSYECRCVSGWEGERCERRTDFCGNAMCENGGVCRSLSSTYRCECLGESFSGRRCEQRSTRVRFLQTFARSVSYVSIVCIVATVGFMVSMDVLTYAFKIDPVGKKQAEVRKIKKKTPPRRVVVEHFVYVNARNIE